MKTYRLSSAGERVSGGVISGLLVLCMGVLLYFLRGDLLSVIIAAIAAMLVTLVLAFYLVSLYKASCVPYPDEKRVTVRGIPDYSLDLSRAACVETAACQNGPVVTRTIVFSDLRGETVAAIPTFFTSHQGAKAEPVAMELAEALDISFRASLEAWEYDKEKRREHERETTRAEKEARKAKMRSVKEKLLRKTGTEKTDRVFTEEEPFDTGNITAEESDGINYDALDDEK